AHPPEDVHARAGAEAEVGDHEVHARAAEPLERLLDRARRVDLVPARRQQALDRDPDRALVVDDEDAGLHDAASPASGRRISNAVAPGRLASVIVPPCASTMRFAIARPSPVPDGFRDTNGSNTLACASAGMPAPSSATRTTARSPSRATASRRCFSGRPFWSASIAVSIRFTSPRRTFSPAAPSPTPSPVA